MKLAKSNAMFKILLTVSTLMLAVACTSAPNASTVSNVTEPRKSFTEENESTAITNAAAVEVNAHSFVEIEFMPGDSELTTSAKATLNSLMAQSANNGDIDEVLVMSWSDSELPSKNSRELPKGSQKLADQRNLAVERYLKIGRKIDVDSYNMTKQPGALAKLFNTTDAKLKNTLVSAGLPTTMDNPQYPSKASHSIVLVKIK